MQADEDVGKVAQVTPVAICMHPSPHICFPPLVPLFPWNFLGCVHNSGYWCGELTLCSEGFGVVYG